MAEAKDLTNNNLLASLPASDLELLQPKLDWVDLIFEDVLYEPNQKVGHAYFPVSGICSVIAHLTPKIRIETGLVGREGFVGINIVHHVDSAPLQVVVQASGNALRISRRNLLDASSKSQTLSTKLLQFAHTFNVQVSQTALSNGRFTINQRLARWLLMCHDRLDTNTLPMTHKFLAVMLAVRRESITSALKFLEGKKAIRTFQGRIVVLKRPTLEKIAGVAYGVPEDEYQRLSIGR